jgi:hypothetical protein
MSVTIDTKRNIAGIGHTGNLKDELLGYWTLGSNSTTQVDAHSGNSFTVSGSGITTNQTGKIGTYAVGDNGTSGNGALLLPVNIYRNKVIDRFTVSYWAKISAYDAVTRFHVYFTGEPTINFQIFQPSSDPGELWFQVRDIDNATDLYTYTSVLSDTTNYQMITCVCNGVGNNSKIYINGVENTVRAATLTKPLSPWGNAVSGGMRILNSYAGGSGAFYGVMCELGIWNRALSPTEITTLYNTGSGRTYPFVGY